MTCLSPKFNLLNSPHGNPPRQQGFNDVLRSLMIFSDFPGFVLNPPTVNPWSASAWLLMVYLGNVIG